MDVWFLKQNLKNCCKTCVESVLFIVFGHATGCLENDPKSNAAKNKELIPPQWGKISVLCDMKYKIEISLKQQ